MNSPISVSELRKLSPLDGLKRENLNSLAKSAEIRTASEGHVFFKQGDFEKLSIYILKGTVDIEKDGEPIHQVIGGSDAANSPLGPVLPRQFSAIAATDVRYLIFDSELLDVMLTWDQTGTYEVTDLQQSDDQSDDWMTTLLQAKAFHRIPPANIQAIFMRLEQVNKKAGEVVIRQDEEGDYFYVVTRGTCVVTRETPLNKEGIRLAELGVGETFGEEALISDAKRNATVSMMTDGSLMRLNKEDFRKLLNEPLLRWVTEDQAEEIIKSGGQWLDVRLPSEFETFHKEGAINVPLYFVRLKLKNLEKGMKYVVCCDTGRRSSAGAFILSEKGFETYVLKGGLNQSSLTIED